jgi:hypothetical protein
MARGYSMPKVAVPLVDDEGNVIGTTYTTNLHPLREAFRTLVSNGNAWDNQTQTWRTYEEIALTLDPTGELKCQTVSSWMRKDFPEISDQKVIQYRKDAARKRRMERQADLEGSIRTEETYRRDKMITRQKQTARCRSQQMKTKALRQGGQ